MNIYHPDTHIRYSLLPKIIRYSVALPHCTGGRQAELFFQKTGEQRGVQVELLRSRQAQLDADGIALRRVGHLRENGLKKT